MNKLSSKLLFTAGLLISSIINISAETPLKSENINDYISENPFETMIRLGRMYSDNPLYQMPNGNTGTCFITTATTTGDGVIHPLNYTRDSSPGKYFVIVSKETSLINRDNIFILSITLNVDPTSQILTLFTDWDRDGEFEKETALPILDIPSKTANYTLAVPATASPGKTRIRIQLEQRTPASNCANINEGIVYDFVIFIMEATQS